ncbi:MAG: ABC transporter ATP-binding protein [Deltaproteobacteria bacterium]|nr:ABC transporter ATP-binding protein [Deltaproteobacteria bacterium]
MTSVNNQREVLRLEGIQKSFGGLLVLSNIDLSVHEREIVGLIGPNGAGKSTLFNIITSIYKPDGGHITLKGKKISGYPSHRICRLGVSRTFQLVKVFLSMTALENVLVGAIYGHKLKGQEARRMALESLELVEMAEKKDEITGKMTLSERRLLEVARALASGPSITLLDEPMAGLNLSETMKMLQVINKAREERNLAILWVEHKMEAIFHLCDRVAVLDYGQKIADGKPDEILNNPLVIEAYFGKSLA